MRYFSSGTDKQVTFSSSLSSDKKLTKSPINLKFELFYMAEMCQDF